VVASLIRRISFGNGDYFGKPILGEMRLCSRFMERFSDRVLETGARLLAIRHKDRQFNTNPSPEEEILPGDVLIVLGTREQVTRIERALVVSVNFCNLVGR
jgi:K+/H+ antiporter YhaU regulatory subunit KhtT